MYSVKLSLFKGRNEILQHRLQPWHRLLRNSPFKLSKKLPKIPKELKKNII